MIKKLITALTTILGVCIIGYMYFNSSMLTTLNAQSAPAFQIPKGAKVVLGKYNNKEIVWDIGNNNNNGNYVLMSSKPIVDEIQTYNEIFPFSVNSVPSKADWGKYCVKYEENANRWFMAYCPVTSLKNEIEKVQLNNLEKIIIAKSPFLPSIADIKNNGTLGLTLGDRAYRNGVAYWVDGYLTSNTFNNGVYKNIYNNVMQYPLLDAGSPFGDLGITYDFVDFESGDIISRNERIFWISSKEWSVSGGTIYKLPIRSFATVKKDSIKFAANTSYTDGAWHAYSIDTSNLNENNELNANKLRIQSSLTAVLQDIKNVSKTKSIQKEKLL